MKWCLGLYSEAKTFASQAGRVARISAELYREAQALHIEATCCEALGHFSESIVLCDRAKGLIILCGVSDGTLNYNIMNTRGSVHDSKSEYLEARNGQNEILRETTAEYDPYTHALALVNAAQIDVRIGVDTEDVQRNIVTARGIFSTMGHSRLREIGWCDLAQADIYLRENDFVMAKELLYSVLKSAWDRYDDLVSYSLERLADIRPWDVKNLQFTWPTLFLVHSLMSKQRLAIYKGLQFIGDTFLAQGDASTAIILFSIALDGFTHMDVHRSRAECMVCLGDISKWDGNLLGAVKHWEMARPLFERSSQTKQVAEIDEHLTTIDQDMWQKHAYNLAALREINTPSVKPEEWGDPKLEHGAPESKGNGKHLDPVAV
jgi:tetratricopeptide (TPR) repeat protein